MKIVLFILVLPLFFRMRCKGTTRKHAVESFLSLSVPWRCEMAAISSLWEIKYVMASRRFFFFKMFIYKQVSFHWPSTRTASFPPKPCFEQPISKMTLSRSRKYQSVQEITVLFFSYPPTSQIYSLHNNPNPWALLVTPCLKWIFGFVQGYKSTLLLLFVYCCRIIGHS